MKCYVQNVDQSKTLHNVRNATQNLAIIESVILVAYSARIVCLMLSRKEVIIMPKSRREVLKMIAEDMRNDAKNFDGKPFNGKTVATYFGHQGAAIASLANIMESIINEMEDTK